MTKLLVAPWRTDEWVVHVKSVFEKSPPSPPRQAYHYPQVRDALEGNPKGIVSSSPGLRACELPWDIVQTASQQGVERRASERRTVEPTLHAPRSHAATLLVAWFALAPLSLSASVGPNYVPPTNSLPPTYKSSELAATTERQPLAN